METRPIRESEKVDFFRHGWLSDFFFLVSTPIFAQYGFLPQDCATLFCKAMHLEPQIKELGFDFKDLLIQTQTGEIAPKVCREHHSLTGTRCFVSDFRLLIGLGHLPVQNFTGQ